MRLVSVGGRSMSEYGLCRKLETIIFNGDTISSIRQTRAGVIARKDNCIKPLQQERPAEVGEGATPARIYQADARREEWEQQNGAVKSCQ